MTAMHPSMQIKLRSTGLTEEQRDALRIERLYLVQVYKGLILVECRCCKEMQILKVRDDHTDWTCQPCDRYRLPDPYPIHHLKKARHERPHSRDHRLLPRAA